MSVEITTRRRCPPSAPEAGESVSADKAGGAMMIRADAKIARMTYVRGRADCSIISRVSSGRPNDRTRCRTFIDMRAHCRWLSCQARQSWPFQEGGRRVCMSRESGEVWMITTDTRRIRLPGQYLTERQHVLIWIQYKTLEHSLCQSDRRLTRFQSTSTPSPGRSLSVISAPAISSGFVTIRVSW